MSALNELQEKGKRGTCTSLEAAILNCRLGSSADIFQAAEELAKLRAKGEEAIDILAEVMSWINNWSPDFCNDDEWGETKEKVDAILGAKK